jgi:hypothetical protein
MSTDSLPFLEITQQLSQILGRKLTAYVGGAHAVRDVDQWIEGAMPDDEAQKRLRFTYELVCLLAKTESRDEIQAWFTGMNPSLGDRAPLQCIRKCHLEQLRPKIFGAVTAFIVGG